ncbi:MAG: hypothetical protein V2A58_00075, partial [Planctomycetota bacterium]
WYVAAGKADPCMLRLLRTPEELDSLFRSGIPDAGLLAEAGAAQDRIVDSIMARHYVPVDAIMTGTLYVRPPSAVP